MDERYFPIVFLLYGLAFFSMGLIVTLEGGRASDRRLRLALRPLAAFGLIHGIHEWIEMLLRIGVFQNEGAPGLFWEALKLGILTFSFLSLTAFGASLFAPDENRRRIILLLPLILVAIWGYGLLMLKGHYTVEAGLWDVADVWTRYVLGIPSAMAAAAGLIVQQRAFRRAGMERFGQDSLWAAVAFAWYGLVGQIFTRPSALPPSTVVNTDLFLSWFGFPVQLLRAAAAFVAAIYVIRFMRSFEVEIQGQIVSLQTARLNEAKQREELRGQLLKRIVAAQEAERKRIARELHDDTGQSLTAVGLGLRGVSTSLQKNRNEAVVHLRHLEDLVTRALEGLQQMIADLRPSHLDDLGLPAALRWYAGELKQRGVLQVSVQIDGEARELESSVKLALFRVAQEALTNVIKHAGTDQAIVELTYGPDRVTVCVQDQGGGFNVHEASKLDRPSWGLAGMRERSSLLGGDFNMDSHPGQGTRICVSIPYQSEDAVPRLETTDEDTAATG